MFTSLGLAVVYLCNPGRELLKAVISVMSSSTEYPESYKNFVFYATGHGADRWFYTEDGLVAYNDVVDKFQQENCGMNFQQRFFFFDCCRSHRQGMNMYHPLKPEFNLTPESRIMYATISGEKSWGEDGVSFMTRRMIEALPRSESMDQVFREVTKGIPQTATYHSAAKDDPALLREQEKRSKLYT